MLTVTAKLRASPNRALPSSRLLTHCAACGELGHQRGDDICKVSGKNAKGTKRTGKGTGKDKPHQAMFVDCPSLVLSLRIPQVTWKHVHPRHRFSGPAGEQPNASAVERPGCTLMYRGSEPKVYQFIDTLWEKKASSSVEKAFSCLRPLSHLLPRMLARPQLHSRGAGTLDANIPLLGSNVLLESLGMMLDLPQRVAQSSWSTDTLQLRLIISMLVRMRTAVGGPHRPL